MAHVSHRLKGAFAGALAGGGDSASSPLYVFGPYLLLVGASGSSAASFGAPLWMVVATVVVVSLMYRKVMLWITDGSGGSGLCEEELGSWAVKVNAAITVIEYTLTFLVSIAALVTFVGDRLPVLAGHWPRAGLAIVLGTITAALVNRGPKTAAAFFGPATLAILVLLWTLIVATVAQRGLHLPDFRLAAFARSNVSVTLAGYVRLLALITGIEVFANLVAAYDGSSEQRARKAFGSLVIIMGTTLAAMLTLGPAIFAIADSTRADVSVFTQTMDALLPAPLPYVGTLIGVFVLLSAAAASAQGLQNLALGLRRRHYVPASLGQRNRNDVAARPVWLQLGVSCVCFAVLGTHEETYLSLYAAGVFVLLSLTSIAAAKRLVRHLREVASSANLLALGGAALSGLVTTCAAGLIFYERARDGAWIYLFLVPAIYVGFHRVRSALGAPTPIDERLGRVVGENRLPVGAAPAAWPRKILVFIDGSPEADAAVLGGVGLSAQFQAPALLCAVGPRGDAELTGYAEKLARLLIEIPALEVPSSIESLDGAREVVDRVGADLVIAAREVPHFRELPARVTTPVLLLRASAEASKRYTIFEHVLVGLDGSAASEATLPYVRAFLLRGTKVTLALVPEAEGELDQLTVYGRGLVLSLRNEGVPELVVEGSGPERSLAELADTVGADVVMVASHGQGSAERARTTELGNVTRALARELQRPLLVIPAHPAGQVRRPR